FLALDDVSVFQPHFAARSKPKILRWRRFHEIVALDIELAAEWDFACSGIWILRVIDRIEFFGFSLRIICQHNFNWSQHDEAPRCSAIEFVTDCVFEQSHVSDARILCDPDVVREPAQCSWRHAAPAQTGNGQHTRVVPTVDELFVYELYHFALAHHSVRQIEP